MRFWLFAITLVIAALIIAVSLNSYSQYFAGILVLSLVSGYLFGFILVYLIYFGLYYFFEELFFSKKILIRSLDSVKGTQHQLSQTELHRISVILRRSLTDVWLLNTPMDEAKIKRGLTSITDNSSQITHFEFDRIKWLFDKGQKKLRFIHFILLAILTFSGFIAGCVMGVYLQNWYHFLK